MILYTVYMQNKDKNNKLRNKELRVDAIISRLDRIMKTIDVPEVPKPAVVDDEEIRLVATYNKKHGAG